MIDSLLNYIIVSGQLSLPEKKIDIGNVMNLVYFIFNPSLNVAYAVKVLSVNLSFMSDSSILYFILHVQF